MSASSAPTDPPPPPTSLLPLARRAADGLETRRARVLLGPEIPALPRDLVRVVRQTWGVEVASADDGVGLVDVPGFALLYARARTEQVLRALSARTNLVLAASRAVVVGDGPVAEALGTALTRIGSRVHVIAAAPTARLRAQLSGLTSGEPGDPAPEADYVVATGEGHAPLAARDLPGVLIDASTTGTAILPAADARTARPHVHERPAGGGWLVDSPPPIRADLTAATALDRHVADAVTALALLLSTGDGPAAVDARLTRLVLA